jgi:hypothetical protein
LARTLAIILAFSILISLALVLGCSSSKDIVLTPQREAGSMRGAITNIVGDLPLANTKVHIISSPFTEGAESETVSTTTYTDENGWYNSDISYGRVVVVVTKDGFKDPDPQLWSLSPGGNGRLDFVMIPGENLDQVDPRLHDPYCLLCHYGIQIPDPNDDGKGAYPPKGTGEGGKP